MLPSRPINDADFPVARVLEAINVAAAEGLTRSRSTWSSSAASTTAMWSTWPATSRVQGTLCASSNTWMWAPPTAGRWMMSSPGAELYKQINEVFPCELVDPNYSGEVAQTLALSRWQGRVRRHLQRYRGLLRRLHPRAAFHRWRNLHMSVRAERLRPEVDGA